MFGYISPEKPELKIKEYELFRAYYCGICKSIGKRLGQIPRLALNYDSAFLAILLSSLDDKKIDIKNERCIAHPFTKKKIIRNCCIIDYASDMNIILAYYNLKDNWKDERSLASAAGMVVLRPEYKKLYKKYKEKCDIINEKLTELAELEKEKCASMDKAAEPFAKLMEEVFAYEPLCGHENDRQVLKWIGYNTGKWIYILDAYDDLENDIKERKYNPFIYQYGYKGGDIGEFKAGIRDKVEFNLTHTLSQIGKAYELLTVKNNAGIIENIIYMGMLRKTEQILRQNGSCNRVEKSI